MFELERNNPIEAGVLTEFFVRCGWQEPAADTKLEWALAASEEWVALRLDGELIGFGRSCRLDVVNRVVFDALVDPRFEGTGLRSAIVRLLSDSAGGLEVVTVFDRRGGHRPAVESAKVADGGRNRFRTADQDTYLGKGAAGWSDGR